MPVVNLRKIPRADRKPPAVEKIIDRSTLWGNPFKIGEDGDRHEVIEKYRAWLWQEIQAGLQGLAPLAELHGKILGCWCAPEPCHGDVLSQAATWASAVLDVEANTGTPRARIFQLEGTPHWAVPRDPPIDFERGTQVLRQARPADEA